MTGVPPHFTHFSMHHVQMSTFLITGSDDQKWSPPFVCLFVTFCGRFTIIIMKIKRHSQISATHLNHLIRSCDTGTSRVLFESLAQVHVFSGLSDSECDGMGCERTSAEATRWYEAQTRWHVVMTASGFTNRLDLCRQVRVQSYYGSQRECLLCESLTEHKPNT